MVDALRATTDQKDFEYVMLQMGAVALNYANR